ncbi:MAG: hypothetical protein ACRDGB_14515, partial [Candidatus Limnocylindria bacterium]
MADKTAVITFTEYPDDPFVVRLSPVALDDWLDIDRRLMSFKGASELLELIDRFSAVAFVGWEGSKKKPTAANLRRYDTNVI